MNPLTFHLMTKRIKQLRDEYRAAESRARSSGEKDLAKYYNGKATGLEDALTILELTPDELRQLDAATHEMGRIMARKEG